MLSLLKNFVTILRCLAETQAYLLLSILAKTFDRWKLLPFWDEQRACDHCAKPAPQKHNSAASQPLEVLTVNMQFFASFPKDPQVGKQKLQAAFGQTHLPDVICMQEGLTGMDVLEDLGYKLVICAGAKGVAQSVDQMMYHDKEALKLCREDQSHALLCNQVYIHSNSEWEVKDCGVEQISSVLELAGAGGRVQGTLAVRSMCWVKLAKADSSRPAVFVMCTHLSGGRFEDQYFVQELARERYSQIQRCIEFFHTKQHRNVYDDVGILVGDFNATEAYTVDGPMNAYFKSAIKKSQGVLLDATSYAVETEEALEDKFKDYMVSPFEALKDYGWSLVYGEEVGATSVFGHLIDYMAVSRPLLIDWARVMILTNQKFKGEPAGKTNPITDHNAVIVRLQI